MMLWPLCSRRFLDVQVPGEYEGPAESPERALRNLAALKETDRERPVAVVAVLPLQDTEVFS